MNVISIIRLIEQIIDFLKKEKNIRDKYKEYFLDKFNKRI